MALHCEHCQKTFPTNTSLYKHKNGVHNNSNLVLVNHTHKKVGDNIPSYPRTQSFPDPDDLSTPKQIRKKPRADGEQRKNKGTSPDEYKIKHNASDGKSPKRKRDPQRSPILTIIDSYEDGGDNSQKRKSDSENYDLSSIDSYEDDGGLSPKRIADSPNDVLKLIDSDECITRRRSKPHSVGTNNYKSLYKECVNEKKRTGQEFRAKMLDNKKGYTSDFTRLEREKTDVLYNIQSQHNKEMQDKQLLHDKQLSDLQKIKDSQCDDRIKQLEKKCEDEKNTIRETFKKQLADEEKESDRKLKLLNNQIRSLQEDDENLNSLTKAIFNSTNMEEISEIQRLVKNHQVDAVVQNHLPTLQNLFLSLSYGILPTCRPQKDQVSDEQRQLVEKIQTASSQTAKKLIKEKHSQVINLFTIIDDSLKLARNTYNRYGIAP